MPYGDDPAGDPADELRLIVGDTEAEELLTDNQVAYFLARAGSPLAGAVLAAGHLAARFSRLVDASTGDVRKSYSQRATGYAALARSLAADVMAQAKAAAPVPWAGGLTYSDMETVAGDPDLVPPYFYEGMDSRPGTTDRAGGPCR